MFATSTTTPANLIRRTLDRAERLNVGEQIIMGGEEYNAYEKIIKDSLVAAQSAQP